MFSVNRKRDMAHGIIHKMLNIEEEGEGGRREWNVEMRLSRV
jgi:hypothetical protein